MRARQIQREQRINAFVVEFAGDAAQHVRSHNEYRRKTRASGVKGELQARTFDHRQFRHKKSQRQHDRQRGCEQQGQARASRFE